ncbi:MAG TPA: prepilin peptidase [Patescibacteria group bacterium]|jgi:leader peptidase (prepilin peptidase)/N-methyltransferase|nr:prepilin peptidase [Patescibacteria group bacterium]
MVLLLFILGLFLGSFLGVLVDRLPRSETVIKGRSHCEFCQKELKWFDLVPVFSFISTKGKCRYCHTSLPYFYPVIEISTGILFMLVYVFAISNFQFLISNEFLNPQFLITLIYQLIVVSGFIVIFFMDLKYGVILDKVLLPLSIIIAVYLFILNPSSLIINFACGVLAFLLFLLIALSFKFIRGKEGMGGGDIKLAFALGLFLGFPSIIVALYLAFLTAAFVGIILILWKKTSPKNASLPFGPFLIIGALICLFWGNLILPKLLQLAGF